MCKKRLKGHQRERRGATWSTQKWFKNQDLGTSSYINLLRRREASPQENPRTRLDVLETARWRITAGWVSSDRACSRDLVLLAFAFFQDSCASLRQHALSQGGPVPVVSLHVRYHYSDGRPNKLGFPRGHIFFTVGIGNDLLFSWLEIYTFSI